MSVTRSYRRQSWLRFGFVVAILLTINFLASKFNAHLDLTEEGRFTLTAPTKKQVKGLREVVFVKVLLDGEFPAGFKRLQAATQELLQDLHGINPLVEFQFENPTTGTVEEINAQRQELAKEGINPVRLNVVGKQESKESYIYPTAIVNYKGRKVYINLLESKNPESSDQEALNNSVSLLEYKFSNAIQKLLSDRKPNILLTKGHEELQATEIADLERSLTQFYNVGRLDLDSTFVIPTSDSLKGAKVDLLIVAKPKTAFSEKHKFLIDQYVMNGGKVVWLIDRLNASLEGMQQTGEMLPTDYPLNLEDQFFKYGFRIQPNMVVDLECTRIPLKVGQQGNAPQMQLFSWYYSPLAIPNPEHPITKSLDRVNLQFPATIDTIRTKTELRKTTLLSSSQYSRMQFTPTKLNFEILRYPAEKEKFNKGNQPMAVMLEGIFPSLYDNRVPDEMQTMLSQLGTTFKNQSVQNKMLVVSDGDLVKNDYDFKAQTLLPLGYNRFENYLFGNKNFILNAIEYMLDDSGIIAARSKEVRLRLLNAQTIEDERTTWQLLNIGIPLLLVGLFATLFLWWRKKKYT